MKRNAGIWIAAGVLAAAGAYFLLSRKGSATAGVMPVTGSASAQPANLAQATGITAPTLSAPTLAPLPSGISSMVSPVGGTIYYQTAMSAPTTSGIAASSSFWNTLTPIAAPSGGWLIDPAGSQAPASLLPWRVDSNGVKYVMWGVDVYQAQGPDSNGNYTGVPVAGTSSALAFG